METETTVATKEQRAAASLPGQLATLNKRVSDLEGRTGTDSADSIQGLLRTQADRILQVETQGANSVSAIARLTARVEALEGQLGSMENRVVNLSNQVNALANKPSA
jgi:polyhydroxyalkanoate synthesis regulator phasin